PCTAVGIAPSTQPVASATLTTGRRELEGSGSVGSAPMAMLTGCRAGSAHPAIPRTVAAAARWRLVLSRIGGMAPIPSHGLGRYRNDRGPGLFLHFRGYVSRVR